MTAIKQTVTIKPGGRIEVVSVELPEGQRAEVIILVDEARAPRRSDDGSGAGQGLFLDLQAADNRSICEELEAAAVQAQERPHEYPTAGFIKETEYTWDEDFFAAEDAVSRYLNESHANH